MTTINFKGLFNTNEERQNKEVIEKVVEETKLENVINTKEFRWNTFPLNKEFKKSVLMTDYMDSKNEEKIKQKVLEFMDRNFSCEVMGKYTRDSFVMCMEEDFNRFYGVLVETTNNPEIEISKSDFWKLLVLYVTLLKSKILPESDMTKDLDISFNESNGRPKLPDNFENNIGVLFNKVLILLTDFFKSVDNGLLNETEEKDTFLSKILLYYIMINVLENHALVDLVTNATEENKIKHFSNLSTDDGKIYSRKIEGFENKNAVKQKQQGSSTENNVEIDLSNISTTNSRKEVISEFEDKNNDSEELPNLERI